MIRAYVNRSDPRRGPVIVELWDNDGKRWARTWCEKVQFAGETSMVSVKPHQGMGFMGWGGPIHTWVESDADTVAAFVGVTHTEDLHPD